MPASTPRSVVPPHLLHRTFDERRRDRANAFGKNRFELCMVPISLFAILGVGYYAVNWENELRPNRTAATSQSRFQKSVDRLQTRRAWHPTTIKPESSQNLPEVRDVVNETLHRVPGERDAVVASWSAHLPRKPIWCFYEARDDRYSVRHLPLELCSVVVFCYLDLTKDGTSVVPTATERERLKQMAERRRAYPWVRVFLGVGGPGALEDGFDAFSARGSSNLTVVRLCRSLRKLSREIGTEGVLFHPPDMVAAAFHAFLIKLHGCLDAFDVEVSVVISDDAIEDVAFLKYAPYFRSFKNVIIWTHTPSTAYAACPFDRATLDPWYQWLERKPLSVLARSVMTLSLGPLHYAAPSDQQARASSCLRQKIGQPPSRVAYAQLCLKVPDMTVEDPPLQPSACSVYRDAQGCYLVFSSRALNSISEAVNHHFRNGLAVVDLNLDDYMGVCGERHRLFNALYNIVDIS